MNRRLLIMLLALVVFAGPRLGAANAVDAAAEGAKDVSIIDQLLDVENAIVTHTDEGVVMKNAGKGPDVKLKTRAAFAAPLVITVVARTDSKELHVTYARGGATFNWRRAEKNLRIVDPKDATPSSITGQGQVPTNAFVTIRWEFASDATHLSIDGVERYSAKGNYDGTSGPVGIGTRDGAVVTIKSITVSHAAVGGTPRPTAEAKQKTDGFVIDVPCAKAAASEPATAPVADADAIERPAFLTTPKALVKSLSTITAMAVIEEDDGQLLGVTHDIIATVPAESRRGTKAGVGFYREDGDKEMKTAFDEALRAVELRYPLWQPGRIDFSFGEKFVSHGGPSAGTAFAVLMLSCLEGFDVDPRCAITGDVSVDWRVRKVGGVTAKLRGATLDKRLYAGIPVDNATAFIDMGLLYGHSALWDLQVFSVANLQQAEALTRADRPAKLAEAINLFAELQPQLSHGEKVVLRSPGTKRTLQHILELAPNHLSAKAVLALCDGTAPTTLSAKATGYQLSMLYYPYTQLINKNKKLDRTSLPKSLTIESRKRLAALRPIAQKDYQPIMGEVATFIETMDELADNAISGTAAAARLEESRARMSAVTGDPKFMENWIREGY